MPRYCCRCQRSCHSAASAAGRAASSRSCLSRLDPDAPDADPPAPVRCRHPGSRDQFRDRGVQAGLGGGNRRAVPADVGLARGPLDRGHAARRRVAGRRTAGRARRGAGRSTRVGRGARRGGGSRGSGRRRAAGGTGRSWPSTAAHVCRALWEAARSRARVAWACASRCWAALTAAPAAASPVPRDRPAGAWAAPVVTVVPGRVELTAATSTAVTGVLSVPVAAVTAVGLEAMVAAVVVVLASSAAKACWAVARAASAAATCWFSAWCPAGPARCRRHLAADGDRYRGHHAGNRERHRGTVDRAHGADRDEVLLDVGGAGGGEPVGRSGRAGPGECHPASDGGNRDRRRGDQGKPAPAAPAAGCGRGGHLRLRSGWTTGWRRLGGRSRPWCRSRPGRRR